jgi:hypothetical protein
MDVFDALCANLTKGQKKIAGAILREGLLNTTIGGGPEPFGSPLSYLLSVPYYGPWFWSGFGRPSPFQHFHGLVSPGRAAIADRRFGGFHR